MKYGAQLVTASQVAGERGDKAGFFLSTTIFLSFVTPDEAAGAAPVTVTVSEGTVQMVLQQKEEVLGNCSSELFSHTRACWTLSSSQ